MNIEEKREETAGNEAVGAANESVYHADVLSMVQEVVFGVGFALLLPIFFGLDGVLYSMPVSDGLPFLISAAAIVYTYRMLGKQKAV